MPESRERVADSPMPHKAAAPDRKQAVSATLTARDDLDHGYHVLHLAAEQAIEGRAGHFAMIRSDAWGHAPLLPRPMSLLTTGSDPTLLIKVVGEGTRRMAVAPLGERFALLAPLGTPWHHPPGDATPILVAGGCGVAPILFLARELAERGHATGGGRPASLALYGGRTAADLPLAEELEQSSELRVTTEDGSRGARGLVTALLDDAITERLDSGVRPCVYACGPHAMLAAVARASSKRDVPCQVSLEALMGCGYGVCLGCPTARVGGGYLYTCTEGPCVDARTVDWEEAQP